MINFGKRQVSVVSVAAVALAFGGSWQGMPGTAQALTLGLGGLGSVSVNGGGGGLSVGATAAGETASVGVNTGGNTASVGLGPSSGSTSGGGTGSGGSGTGNGGTGNGGNGTGNGGTGTGNGGTGSGGSGTGGSNGSGGTNGGNGSNGGNGTSGTGFTGSVTDTSGHSGGGNGYLVPGADGMLASANAMVPPQQIYPVPTGEMRGKLACNDGRGTGPAFINYTVLDAEARPLGVVQEARLSQTGAIKMIRFLALPQDTPRYNFCVAMKNDGAFRVVGGAVQVPLDGARVRSIIQQAQNR